MTERWLKAELHSHCRLDPDDYRIVEYSTEALISEAARLGYDVLAITCHNLDLWNRELADYAENLGITLIPGMEVTVERRFHTLAYNFRTASENLDTFAKIRDLRRADTLVIAPHPFFPATTCLRGRLEPNIDVYDAVECSGFYLPWFDFNHPARRLALKHGKPMVGNGDVHFLWQLGKTFTWIYAEPEVLSILNAVKCGRVRLDTVPLSPSQVARWWSNALWHTVFPASPAPDRAVGPIVPDLP